MPPLLCRLDPEPDQAAHAREWARKALPGWGLDEHADLVELVVSELVANAICHGEGQVALRLSYVRGDLWIEVTDHGAGWPLLRHPSIDDTSGRGLALIDAITELGDGTWGVTRYRHGRGKTVYAALPLPARHWTAGA